jgi:Family of unknown function (DUF5681)
MGVVRAMSNKSGQRNPPKHSHIKKSVPGRGRRKSKSFAFGDIISKVQNTPTAYREGGQTKRAPRIELVLKQLVNRALEGDAKSAKDLFALRAKASKSSDARAHKIIVEDWIPDFEGQTGEQKTRAHARETEIDPTGFSERTASDPPGSASASPKAPRDE